MSKCFAHPYGTGGYPSLMGAAVLAGLSSAMLAAFLFVVLTLRTRGSA